VITGNGIVAIADIPVVSDIVKTAVGAPAGWAWEKVTSGLTSWILGAVGYFVDGVLNFLKTAARPDVTAAWFAGSGSPYATVRTVAVTLLLGFVLLGLLQGLLAGDANAMLRRVVSDLPFAVLGMIATTVIVAKLLDLTDALSTAVLGQSGGQAVDFLSGFGVQVTGATQGFAAVLLGIVAVLAAFFVWVELMVRSVLVYVLVALSPLAFAASVWPVAKGIVRKLAELLIAIILSKLVVCIAISVGVAALAGNQNSTAPANGSGDPGASLGALFVGTAVLGLAAFAPFMLLKLIPVAEAAIAAQGISRSPARAATSTVHTVQMANSMSRLAGSNGARAASHSVSTNARVEMAPAASASRGAPAAASGAVAGGAVIVGAGASAATTAARAAHRSAEEAKHGAAGGGAQLINAPRRRPPTAPPRQPPHAPPRQAP
jgi:hypothetical protein